MWTPLSASPFIEESEGVDSLLLPTCVDKWSRYPNMGIAGGNWEG